MSAPSSSTTRRRNTRRWQEYLEKFEVAYKNLPTETKSTRAFDSLDAVRSRVPSFLKDFERVSAGVQE